MTSVPDCAENLRCHRPIHRLMLQDSIWPAQMAAWSVFNYFYSRAQ